MNLKRYLHTSVPSRLIYNSQHMETGTYMQWHTTQL